MKTTFPFRMALVVAAAVTFLHQNATAATIVNLGDASSFAVLAAAGITITGPNTITGDIGSYPTTAITGPGSVTYISGANQGGDAATILAKTALGNAYLDAAGQTPTTIYAPIADLGGRTLTPGVYNDPTSFMITGTLTLDARGDPNAVWIFQAGSTLGTAAGPNASKVVFLNGVGDACNVFWQVGSSATIGTYSDFVGNILAHTTITVNTGATVDGRLLAGAEDLTGAVTLDTNIIDSSACTGTASVPDTGSTLLLLGSGLGTLLAFRRRFFSPA